MSEADRIRNYALTHIIEPARRKGFATISIQAGDVGKALGIMGNFPNICQALGGWKFQELANVPEPTYTRPNPSSSTVFTYKLTTDRNFEKKNTATTEMEDRIKAEDAMIAEIQGRTGMDETAKCQLIQARKGQGIYRTNVEKLENTCHLTGASDLKHLRARHIKPWRNSNDGERLDGNNGLLLSPHIDHLFDQGFISAKDNGDMLLSDELEFSVLECWGIVAAGFKPFRAEQLKYIKYHRENILKR